ncbi:hypothetical protein WJX74_005735 [Apatococcus lobatus]|uniref:SMP-LTD domain-containing protein n=2 Tax=Apatococcus TaxID=904362 RepID=A0AAW1T8A7_9CHLO
MQKEAVEGDSDNLPEASTVSWLREHASLLVGTASGLYIIRCLPNMVSAIGFQFHVLPLLLMGAIMGILGLLGALALLVYLITTKDAPKPTSESLSDFGAVPTEEGTSGVVDAEKPVLVSGPGKALALAGRDVSRPAGQTGGVPGVDMPPHSIMLHGSYSGTIWTVPSTSWKRSDIVGGWPPKTIGAKAVTGMRRWHANLQDNTLHLTTLDPSKPGQAGKEDAKGMQQAAADIPLEGCTVTVVTEGLRGKTRWTRKAPLEVSHPSGQLLDGRSSFMLFAVGSAAKEQWFNAITWACQQGGDAAGVEALYSNFCANAYALGLAPYPQLSGEDMTANESMNALKAAGEAKAGRGWLGSWRSGKDSKGADAKAEARAEAKAAKDAKKAEKQAAKAKAANLHSSSPPAFVDPSELDQLWMRTNSQRNKVKAPDSPFNAAASSPGTPTSPLPEGPSLSIRMPSEEAPGQELKVMTKSAPASQAVSRSSTRPSSPMPILPQQHSGSGNQAGEPEQAAGTSPAGPGLASKSVTFSKSLPKDIAHLPSRPESPATDVGSVVGRLRSHSESAARDSSIPAVPSTPPQQAGPSQLKAAPLFEPHHVDGHPMKGYPTMLVEHAINALLARVGFDLLRNPVIKQKIQEKIQAKVNNQRVPEYIQSLQILDLHLGNNVPTISNLRAMPSPSTTIWPQALFHFDWQGEIEVVVECKVNVRDAPAWATFEKAMQSLEGTEQQAAAASSEAMHRPADDHPGGSSADSSEDESDPLQRPAPLSRAEEADTTTPPKTPKEAVKPKGFSGLLQTQMAQNLRKRITTNVRSFAEATAESINKMQLRVCIDIRSLRGDICAWLPPPPGDRLWYSFLSAPSLELDVKPVVGGRWLKHTTQAGRVSKWIAAKISSGITKNMVFPSCNDLVLPGLLAIDHPQAAARFPAKPAFDTLVPEAKSKVDDKASGKASSKPTEVPPAASTEPGASLKYPSDAKSARPALGGLLRLNAHKDAAIQQSQKAGAAASLPSMIELSSKPAPTQSPGDAAPLHFPAPETLEAPTPGAGTQPATATQHDSDNGPPKGSQHTSGPADASEMPNVDTGAYARMGLATTPTPTLSSSPAAVAESADNAAPQQTSPAGPGDAPAVKSTEPHAPSLLSHAASSPRHDPIHHASEVSTNQASAGPSSADDTGAATDKAKTVRRSVSELPAAGQKLPETQSAPVEEGRPSSARVVAPANLRSSASQQQQPDGSKRDKASVWFKSLEAQHPKWTHQGVKLVESWQSWRGPGQEQPKSPKPIKPVEL